MKKAIFLDKDGTLIPDIPYNVDPDLITLQPNAVEGLRALQQNGYLIIIISNQAGVARGLFKEDGLQKVKEKIADLLMMEQVRLDGFYYCPHHPDGLVEMLSIKCDCRKPAPGMFYKAAHDLNIDLSQSWMIGDILNDVEAAKRAGCGGILINNGNETEWQLEDKCRIPDYLLQNINEAALLILRKAAKHLIYLP